MNYQAVKDVYFGKSVMITGHTGFKGAWLAIWLQEMGCRVSGIALENREERSTYRLSRIGERMGNSYIADIRDAEKLWQIFEAVQPDFVFHLAAQPLVRLAYAHPVDTYATNVMGTVNVLECIRHLKKDVAAVMITTDKCYENREWDWGYRETDRLGGHDPYSSSKACCELAISSWRRSFFDIDGTYRKYVSSARAGNVIGGGDWAADRIIPDCIRALEADEPILLRNPAAVRPWQHVLEPLWGYVKLGAMMCAREIKPDAWNFGPDYASCISVGEIAGEIIARYGRGSCCAKSEKDALTESKLLRLDNSKAKNELGWKPVWNVKEAVVRTVDWYKNDHIDAYELCTHQIKDYIDALESIDGTAI